MAIKTVKQAAAAIEELQEQVKQLEDDLASEKSKTPETVDLSGIEAKVDAVKAGCAVLAASVKVLAEQVTELAEAPPAVPDVDTLIKILGEKVMFRMR